MPFAARFQKLFPLPHFTKLRPPATSLILPLPCHDWRELTRLLARLDGNIGIVPSAAAMVCAKAGGVNTQTLHRPWKRLHLRVLAVLMLVLAWSTLTSTAQAQGTVKLAWKANPESDIAGYKIHLGTVSGQLTQFQNVGHTSSTVLSGLTPATTYYAAVQAYNSFGLNSKLSAEISFTTHAPAMPFKTWATVGGLSDSAATPAAMPFTDGVPNLLKYAFNLNPAGPDVRVLAAGTGTVGLPAFILDRSESQTWFTVEFLRRKRSELVYLPQISRNLVTFETMTGTTTVTNINDEWDRVIIQMPCDLASTPRLFGRVEVTLPEITAVPFNTWASAGGLSDSAATPAAMPFTDGVPNLLKYAFNLNPAGPDMRVLAQGSGAAGLPAFALARNGSQTWFTVEFLRRIGSGLVYTPKISSTLVTFEPMAGMTTVTNINDEWERVIIQQPCDLANTPRLFGRVEVSLP